MKNKWLIAGVALMFLGAAGCGKTEEEEVVYTLSDIFPDETLREMIKDRLGTGQETATEDALKNITEIYSYRTDFNEAAVKDITGLDKLTGLMNLVLEKHAIKTLYITMWRLKMT